MEPRPLILFLERGFSTSSMMCFGIFLSAVSDRANGFGNSSTSRRNCGTHAKRNATRKLLLVVKVCRLHLGHILVTYCMLDSFRSWQTQSCGYIGPIQNAMTTPVLQNLYSLVKLSPVTHTHTHTPAPNEQVNKKAKPLSALGVVGPNLWGPSGECPRHPWS